MATTARAATPDPLALNPRAQMRVLHVGAEREPVLVIDDVLATPGALVDYAATQAAFRPAAEFHSHYPGLLAPAPLGYVERVVRALAPLVVRAFGLPSGAAPGDAQCYLSLVTLAPEALSTGQRLPHVDTTDPRQFAVLHYLCDGARFGGTAFYRHRATGFETLDEARAPTHRARLDAELAQAPPPAAYVAGDTPQYAMTGAVEARFDRLVAYRSRLLHSGLIAPDAPLSPDPRTGRLTANIFVNFRGG